MFGFRAESDSGSVQVSDDFQNVAYVGSVHISPSVWVDGPLSLDVPDHDFVFFGDTSGGFISLLGNIKTGTGRTLLMFPQPIPVNTVTVYLYARQPPTAGLYGLHIRNESNQLTFSSNDNHLSVLAGLSWPRETEGAEYTAPDYGQTATIVLPPLPTLRSSIQIQGQLVLRFFGHRAVKVDESSRKVTLGGIRRGAGVWRFPDGPMTEVYPWTGGAQILVAGHYGNV